MGDETKLQGGRTGKCDEQVRALLERAQDPSRVLALSDGVFAIIITLLVLEIHVPELTQGHTLTEALAEVRPSFYAFAVSFILAGMYWVGHRDLLAIVVAGAAPSVSLLIYAGAPVLYFVSITVLRSSRNGTRNMRTSPDPRSPVPDLDGCYLPPARRIDPDRCGSKLTAPHRSWWPEPA
jgi:hypothetical protein